MEAQASFLDMHVAPDIPEQRSLWDDFTRMRNESNEKVERPTAETHRTSLSLQSAFCREKTEWAECDDKVRVVEHSRSLKDAAFGIHRRGSQSGLARLFVWSPD